MSNSSQEFDAAQIDPNATVEFNEAKINTVRHGFEDEPDIQQRRWIRVELEPGSTVPATIVHSGQELPVHIRNQSLSGVGVSVLHRFAKELRPGDTVSLRYGDQEVEGIIRHVTSSLRCVDVGIECN